MSSSKECFEKDIVGEKANKLSYEDAIDLIFPYATPYEDQQVGIENTLNALYANGFHLIEGPCGTGKTLISLTAALGAIRNPDTKYKRALVITSVKQQQKAFEHDISEINEAIIDKYGNKRKAPDGKGPVNSLTIVGKQDLCPYVDSGAIENSEISYECSQLKQSTYDVSHRISTHDNHLSDGANKIIEAGKQTEGSNQSKLAQQARGNPTHDQIEDAAFQPHPIAQYEATVCPYYAQALIDDEKGTQTMKYDGMMDAANLRDTAAQLGTCPYEVMNNGITEAEVVIGNYAHVFDENTVQATTQSIIDEETILIVDEAHMLIERARDQLSQSITRSELTEAIDAIELLHQNKDRLTSRTRNRVDKELRHAQTSLAETRIYKQLFEDLIEFIDTLSDVYCERQYNNSDSSLTPEEKIPLRDPESTQTGQLMSWFEQQPYETELYEDAKYKTKAISNAVNTLMNDLDDVAQNVNPNAVEGVGGYISKKYYADEQDYITKVEMAAEDADKNIDFSQHKTAHDMYTIELNTENCIPAYDLATQFNKFGGGIVMSATLSPIDITSEIIGLGLVETGYTSDVFDLSFPPENRESYIVGLDKYTSNNRGSVQTNNDVRQQYKETIKTIVETTRGNTLVCMPKYSEAKWIGEYLDETTNTPVYIDESSSNAETTNMREDFIDEQKAVLTTSLRGTLTEGVDYDGDDLQNVIVVGVPLTNPNSYQARAIRTVFGLNFGKRNAFDYAFTLPAIFKSRQALGRVIRSKTDVGMRFLLDERYTKTSSPHEFLTEQQQTEYQTLSKDGLTDAIRSFWNEVK